MSSDIFTPLQTLRGTPEEQLNQIYRYLFQLADQLNRAVTTAEQNVVVLTEKARSSSVKESIQSVSERAAALMDLITANAELVTTEIGNINYELESLTSADSEFGSWRQSVNTAIALNASNIEAHYTEQLDIQSAADTLERYKTLMDGYIRAGIVRHDGVTPVLGIMISQDFTIGAEEQVGDETYSNISSTSFHSVFTANSLEFYDNDVKVAYITDERLYITDAIFVGKTQYGPEGSPKWEINYTNGFTIKYVGG